MLKSILNAPIYMYTTCFQILHEEHATGSKICLEQYWGSSIIQL